MLAVIVLVAPTSARADEHASRSTPEESTSERAEAIARARAAYRRGRQWAKKEQWGEALAAFEQAAAEDPAPLVRYSIVYCQRALGRYVAARATAKALLAHPKGLAPSYRKELEAYVREFDAIIAEVEVEVSPAGSRLTVDGRPLVKQGKLYYAGLDEPQSAGPTGGGVLRVRLDPGDHLFRAQRVGFAPVVVRRTYRPGERARVRLDLEEMPATIVVDASAKDATVRIDEREAGLAPITLQRPAGTYELTVEKDDFETYRISLDLDPGQRTELKAELVPYVPPLYERWWFWTGIGGVVAGGVALSVALTRPEPEPAPYQTGNTGWLVQPSAIRF